MLMQRQISRAQLSCGWCLLCFIMQMTTELDKTVWLHGMCRSFAKHKFYAMNKMLFYQVAQSGGPPCEKN